METLRHAALQAELKKIEATAEANSFSIMNKADQLARAHALCHVINDGAEKTGDYQFRPVVCYQTHGCDINIFTIYHGALFMRRLTELGLAWSDEERATDDLRRLSVDGYPGVDIIMYNNTVNAAKESQRKMHRVPAAHPHTCADQVSI